MKRWLFAILTGLALLGLVAAPLASADSYTDGLAAKLGPNTHVVADPTASPALANPDKINSQILGANVPIYVVAVAPGQTDKTTPDALQKALSARIGKEFAGIILVMDTKGYHTRAYHVSQQVANAIDPTIKDAAKAHKNDPYGAITQFVDKIAALRVPASGPSASATGHAPADNTGWWVFAWIVGGLTAIGLGIWGFLGFSKRSAKRKQLADKIDGSVIQYQSRVDDLGQAVLDGARVEAEHSKALLALADAKTARQRGNLNAAQAYLATVAGALDKGEKKLNPVTEPDWGKVEETPLEERKQATVRATNLTSGKVQVIDNTDYRRKRSSSYQYYHPGGDVNGVYFYPGYYPVPFGGWGWTPADIIIADALLHDHHYDHREAEVHHTPQSDVDYSEAFEDRNWDFEDSDKSDTTFSGGDDSISDQSHVTFSGDDDSTSKTASYGFADTRSDDRPTYRAPDPDPTPAYSPPAYDPPSFGGGGDFGGGSTSDTSSTGF